MKWDTGKLRETIINWPPGTSIIWSKVATDHGIPGKNGGQVAKEFIKKEGIDTSHIVTPRRKPTRRPRKKKIPGTEVSIPSIPPVGAIQAEIKAMISSGRFTLGIECAPFTLIKYYMDNGEMTPHEVPIQGRKVPLKVLRQKLLGSHFKYMRLVPESTIATMSRPELNKRLNLNFDDKSEEELRHLLCQSQRSRNLCLWHDHATILNRSYFMLTVHVMYDPVVFYTQEEWLELHPNSDLNVQAEEEQPLPHFFTLGSSSIEDQAALTGDRLSCIEDMSEPVETETGIEIKDSLRYFTGDHPATQFERGTKIGGTYKCAVCGIKSNMYNDQAHTLQQKWRNVEQLQTVVVSGKYGRKAGELQPFKLRIKELREELEAREVYVDEAMLKPQLQSLLEDHILRGVSRVPALLLTDPMQELASINLDRYEIVASEPLHDIKSHLVHVMNELPHILPPGDTRNKYVHLLTHSIKILELTQEGQQLNCTCY